MALANMAAYLAAMAGPHQRPSLQKSITIPNTSVGTTVAVSSWTAAPNAGATPGAAATVDRTAAGALGQFDPATELRLFIEQLVVGLNTIAGIQGTLVIADRLVHSGGLDATNIGVQTINTPAVPRYTPATDRLRMAAELYLNIGATQTTITASYTNQGGTAGQISQPVLFGGTNQRSTAGVFMPLSLAAGDVGVSSVQNVTVLASTGTVGNFGITIYKPLLMVPFQGTVEDGFKYDPVLRLGALMPQVLAGACLFAFIVPSQGSSGVATMQLNCQFGMFED